MPKLQKKLLKDQFLILKASRKNPENTKINNQKDEVKIVMHHRFCQCNR